jgi:cytochrome c-type biogenesis protein CcmH
VRSCVRWAALGAMAAAVAVSLAVGAHRPAHASLASQTMHIAGEVRCPVCEAQTAAQSQVPAAIQIRDEISSELRAGESATQILDGLAAAYGPGILERPRASGVGLLVWVLPLAVVGAAAGGLALAFARWRRRVGSHPWVAGVRVRLSAAVGRGRKWWALAGVGLALIGGGASWAAVAATSPGSPSRASNRQATLSAAEESQLLQAGAQATGKGDALSAIKDYQHVLASDPTNAEALSAEGWLLVQTGEEPVVQQGLAMLASAEKAQPTYPPAHLYRGLALLAQGQYAPAAAELRWYLAHSPAPQLVTQVRKALADAQAGAG